MPDYIYLLENRLSADQRNALAHLREAAREAETILFLTGDAVRDLTSGHAVRELEVAVHGNALKLKKTLEKRGAKVWGEDDASRSLYLCFPGTVRVDVVTTHRIEYPKPGKAVYHPAAILESLRSRDFTANAMAISLNEGSFGLLMDPLNGAADIEARTLRLVSNYGFLEDPSLLIRATRYKARLGWEMDPRTQTRYDNAKGEGVIEFLSAHARSQELEQIGHEEDGLKVLRALEEEGWMKVLYPAWSSSKADEAKLTALHELAVELFVQGVHPDMSAAQMELLTSGLNPRDLAGLKKALLRPGFVEEWDSLGELASGFQKVLLAKQNATASATYKLFMSYDPEAILWLGFTSKSQAVQDRFNQFLRVWPAVRQQIPHTLMQEMRITPELPAYNEIVLGIFLELIDGKLQTPEEMRAYLEPHSPPAPPPQPTFKRPRGRRSEAKLRELEEEEENEANVGDEEDMDDELGGGDEDGDLGVSLKSRLDQDEDGEAGEEKAAEEHSDSDEDEEEPAPRRGGKKIPTAEPVKQVKTALPEKPAAKESAKAGAHAAPAKPPAEKHAPASRSASNEKPVPAPPKAPANPKAAEKAAQSAAKPAPAKHAKPVPAKSSKPQAKKSAPVHITGKGGVPPKPAPKPPAKSNTKAAAKPSPAKKAVAARAKAAPAKHAKPVAKKALAKKR